MKNLRVNADDIIFLDGISIFEEYDTIYAYLSDCSAQLKLAGSI